MSIANIILTALLVIAASWAAYFARGNLLIMRKQIKLNTLLALLKDLSDPHARKNRGVIFQNLSSSEQITNNKEGIIKERIDLKHCKEAIEETVSCLDRLGFFLLEGDPELKEKAPEFIWEITSQMWARTEWYVLYRRQSSEQRTKEYGRYFEKLNKEAKKHGYIEQLNRRAE